VGIGELEKAELMRPARWGGAVVGSEPKPSPHRLALLLGRLDQMLVVDLLGILFP